MKTDQFPHEASQWAPTEPGLAQRWNDELEKLSVQTVRARLAQTDAGSAGAAFIGSVQMTVGFAEEWLAWHDRKRQAAESKPHKKHWLDWAGWVVAVISLGITIFTTYRTSLIQRDDVRVVVEGSLEIRPDKGDLLIDQDQQFTFINSGNRAAVISEIYAELVLVTNPDTKCDGRLAKSIVLNPTQIVVKPGDILPTRANVIEHYPWVKEGNRFRFRRGADERSDSYIVCLHIFVTTPDSASTRWVQKLQTVPANDDKNAREQGRAPFNVIQRTRWSLT